VETPGYANAGPEERRAVEENLRFAEDLGAGVLRVRGNDPAEALLQAARDKNAGSIVIGAARRRGVFGMLGRSTVGQLTKAAKTDVYVVAPGDDE